MEVLLQTYYILLPIIATALIGWVGKLLNDQIKKEKLREKKNAEKEKEIARIRKANSNGIKLVLRYMLNRYHAEYKIQGKITYEQYRDWKDMYSAYEALGGNSIAVEWNEDIEEMEKCNYLDGTPAFETMILETMKNSKKTRRLQNEEES